MRPGISGRSRIEDGQIGIVNDQIGVEDLAIGIDLFDDRADRQVLILGGSGRFPRARQRWGCRCSSMASDACRRGRGRATLGSTMIGYAVLFLEARDPVAQAAHGGVNKVLLVGLRIDEVLVLTRPPPAREGRGGGRVEDLVGRSWAIHVVTGRQVAESHVEARSADAGTSFGTPGRLDLGTTFEGGWHRTIVSRSLPREFRGRHVAGIGCGTPFTDR